MIDAGVEIAIAGTHEWNGIAPAFVIAPTKRRMKEATPRGVVVDIERFEIVSVPACAQMSTTPISIAASLRPSIANAFAAPFS